MDFGKATIVGYVLLLAAYGIAHGAPKSYGEFAAGRSDAPLLVITASLCASFVGGGFSLGNAQNVFSRGISEALVLLGFTLSLFICGLFFVPGLRRLHGLGSAGAVIGKSCGPYAGALCSMSSVLFCIGVLAAQIKAAGVVAGYMLGIAPSTASAVFFAVTIAYASLGGLKAAQKSDTLQIVALVIGLVLVVSVSLVQIGGFAQLQNNIPQNLLSVRGVYSPSHYLFAFLTFMTGEFLCPPTLSRMLSCKNTRLLRCAVLSSGVLSVFFFAMTALAGLAARALNATDSAEFALPALVGAVLPVLPASLICAAMLAVYMSSGGSFLNAAACAFMDGILPSFMTNPPCGRAKLRTAQFVSLFFGCAALIAALLLDDVISVLVFSYSFWAPVSLVPLIAIIFGRDVTQCQFFVTAACGSAAAIAGRAMLSKFSITPSVAGVLAAAAAFIIFILLKRNSKT
ncbi:MAG: hypothetical protein RR368_02300 [Oscillospiraceae bacterium]